MVPHDIENNAGKARQTEIADKYVNVTEAIREHHAKNRLNSARRPKVAAVRIDLLRLLQRPLFATRCGSFDILPSASKVYAKKVGRLTEALNQAEDRTEATEALRSPIESQSRRK